MLKSIMVATAQEISSSTPRLVAAIAVVIGVVWADVIYYMHGGASCSLPNSYLAVVVAIFAAGIIGNDYSGGILPLFFARPVFRWQYITGKLLTVAILSCAFMLILDALAIGIALPHPGVLPSTQSLGLSINSQMLRCIGLSTVIVFFSTLLPSLGDVALYGALCGLVSSLPMMAQWMKIPGLAMVSRDLDKFINPGLDLRMVLLMEQPSWGAILTYVSLLAMFYTAAIIIINRKEISYGAE